MGVVGAPGFRFEFLKNIVIDIAARHYFSDVQMIFVAEKANKEQIQWLRMLPHVYNDVIGTRNIVCDDESKNIVFEYLYKELTIREQNKKHENNIVIFFYDEYGFKSHPISKFIEKAKDLGVTFVFFGNTIADIPQGCGYVAEILDRENAVLINAENKSESAKFTYPIIATAQAESIVNLLAPVYTEEISLEGTLTKNITMFELLNILAVDDIDLKSRWAQSQVFKSMAAPLGVSKTGVVALDLHDKAHGPHPGGGVQNGAMAQEECLCRSSILYPCLIDDNVFTEYYQYHKELKNTFFSDRLIYTKDVTVFKDDNTIPQMMPALPKRLEDIICKCIEPNPDKRYQSAAALMAVLNGEKDPDGPKGLLGKIFGKK